LFEHSDYKPEVVTEWLQRVNGGMCFRRSRTIADYGKLDLDNAATNRVCVKYRYAWGVKKALEE
jgi:hypothetical protein